jgi:hypothetical protein
MKTGLRLLLLGTICTMATLAQAHHSFSGIFDGDKPIEVTGVITKVDWVNPHSYVHLQATDKNGQKVDWSFESLPPAFLKRAGFKREMLPIGSTVTIFGFAARDGSQHLGWVKKYKFPDGREIQVTADNPADAKFN